jgi:large subunit ribosomal protein L25
MHPWKKQVLHVDFQRVAADQKIHMRVPFHFVHADRCPGVREGGLISHVMNELDVQCLPDDLPEFIAVDLADLALGQSIHVAEVALPTGVELVPRLKADNPVVVSVQVLREAGADAAGGEAAEASGTEIISEKAAADGEK